MSDVEAADAAPVKKWRGETPRALDLGKGFASEWAEFGAVSAVDPGDAVRALFRFQLRWPGSRVPERLVLSEPFEVGVPGSGTTSVRVPDELWAEYRAACRQSDTSVAREVRGLVRWWLGRAGARRPEPLRRAGRLEGA